jgi:hypothetical protein
VGECQVAFSDKITKKMTTAQRPGDEGLSQALWEEARPQTEGAASADVLRLKYAWQV